MELSKKDQERKDTLKKEMDIIIKKEVYTVHDLENAKIIITVWEKHKY